MSQSTGGTAWDVRSLVTTPMGLVILCFFALFWIAVVLIPVAKVLKRTGHSPLWSVFFLIPAANVLALWIFAVKPWPTDKHDSTGSSPATL